MKATIKRRRNGKDELLSMAAERRRDSSEEKTRTEGNGRKRERKAL